MGRPVDRLLALALAACGARAQHAAAHTAAPHRRHLVSAHPDTVTIDQCFSVLSGLPLATTLALSAQGVRVPSLCLAGETNLCTNDINLTVTVSGGQPVRFAIGDGTAAPTVQSPWVVLPDDLFPGSVCDNSRVRLRDAVVAARGLRACVDLRISCLPTDVNLPCIDIGDDTDACTATDKCGCIQHPECGWCSASTSCTRMLPTLPTAENDGQLFSTTNPVCGCAGELYTAATDPSGTCAPRLPPAPPPAQPPPPPAPPGLPPSYPPFIEPSWVNGIAFEQRTEAVWPLFVQRLLWALTSLGVVGTLVRVTARERRRTPIAARYVSPSFDSFEGAFAEHEAASASNEALLATLPTSVQYAAGRALEESSPIVGRPPVIMWLCQPRLLPSIGLPLALWLVFSVGCLALLVAAPGMEPPLATTAQPLPILLVVLPVAYTLAMTIAIRRATGTVYALTESGAILLSLTPTIPLPWSRTVWRTSYSRMLAQSAERPLCAWATLTCSIVKATDVVFASAASLSRPAAKSASGAASPESGPTRFRAVPRCEVAGFGQLIVRQMARERELSREAETATEMRGYAANVGAAETELVGTDAPWTSSTRSTAGLPQNAIPRVPIPVLSTPTKAVQYADNLEGTQGAGTLLTERSDRTSSSDRPGRAFSPRSSGSERASAPESVRI